MTIDYTPHGICAQKITVSAENGIITGADIVGGCDGNHKGVAALIKCMELSDAISRIKGIRCGKRDTSCPDQLSLALQQLLDAGA